MVAILPLPLWVPTRKHQIERHAIRELHRLIGNMIRTRRNTGEDRGDLLSMILLSSDENGQMSEIQARDEAISLFIAGYETTANALAWTFYALSQNPDVEARLATEIKIVLEGRTPIVEDLRNLKYTEMVIRESMRLHPPLWILLREVIEDIQVGEYTLPKGNFVEFCPHVTHRDPRWFPKPEQFIPERFEEGWEKRIPKGAYFPFGMGPRFCIGQSFAMMEAQILLAMIIQRWQLTLVPGQKVVPQPMIAQRPWHGLHMMLTKRESA
jgi:cytochrome P450